MPRTRTFRNPSGQNVDPPLVWENIDVTSVDFTPSGKNLGKIILKMNAATAGLVYVTKLDGTTGHFYLNTGWQAVGACIAVLHASTAALDLAVGYDDNVAIAAS